MSSRSVSCLTSQRPTTILESCFKSWAISEKLEDAFERLSG